MKVDLEVPITAPPLHLFKVGKEGRDDITDRSYRGFGDVAQTTVKFQVYDGEYVVVDFLKQERKFSVVGGQVIEIEEPKAQVKEEPVQEQEASAETPEADAPMSFKKKDKGIKSEEM
jgi:hypothetical protein